MIRLNRLAAVLLLLCAMAALPASAELSPESRAVLLDRTEALTAQMLEAANSDAYMRLYLGDNDQVRGVIRQVAGAGWTRRTGGTIYVLKDGAIEAFLNASNVSLSSFPESIAVRIRQSVIGSIPNALNNAQGVSFMAATSVLRTGTVFLADEAFPEYALVCLSYNRSYGVLCSFVKGEDNVVSASLVPIVSGSDSSLKSILGLRSIFGGHSHLYEDYPVQ